MNLLEIQLQDYIIKLLPATTIFNSQGTVYKNPIFNRQRFVYKEGINAGSEFKTTMPPNYSSSIKARNLEMEIVPLSRIEIEIFVALYLNTP